MSTRIRYVSTNRDDVLRSFRNLYSPKYDSNYSIEIDTKELTFVIRNVNSGRTYTGGENINNLHVLKRKVKSRLSEMGVSFGTEVRDNSCRVVGKNCAFSKKVEK